jgi:phosphoglycolate phosphatase
MPETRHAHLFRAVIFDLDGTLLNTLEDLADAMNCVLAANGHPAHPLDAYRYFVGDGIEMLVRRALPEGGWAEEDFPSIVEAMRDEYARRSTNKTRPYPGIPELLDVLQSRGVPFAILSNKPHPATVDLVGRLLGRWRFSSVLGARASVAKKPDPAGALEIAGELDLAPAAIVYVGDTPVDMGTARAAGMFPAGVLWGFRGEAELRDAGARALLAKPRDLLSLLFPEAPATSG